MKEEIYVGGVIFSAYEIENFIQDNIELLLNGHFKKDSIYKAEWRLNYDCRDEVIIEEYRLETDNEFEFRENQERQVAEERKRKKEEEERLQYEKLKAKFEK